MANRILTAKVARAGVALTAVIGVVVGIQAGLAQGADSVTVDVGECVNLQSPEERFACYERHVEATSTAPAVCRPLAFGRPIATRPEAAGTAHGTARRSQTRRNSSQR